LGLLVAGCGEKPVTRVYEAAHERPITCLRLAVFPASAPLEKALKGLYPFRDDCPVLLEVRHKENICCNSTQNVEQKTLSNFPHHFLRLELRRGMTPLYSYYIDLDHPADAGDAQAAFETMKKALGFR
jgi:hypothetical protein